MAGEVAVKKMNFLLVILFQALPIAVSGETVKNIQARGRGVATDPDVPAFPRGNTPRPVLRPHGGASAQPGPLAVGARETQIAAVHRR